MKVLLLWVVAAWVVAVTADRPCTEYCAYLSYGSRERDIQPGCDCMYEETELDVPLDDSRIYYEPVDYIPLSAYIHNQPFYILNPIIQGRQTYSTKPNPSGNVYPRKTSRTYNTEIYPNIENTQPKYNRQERRHQEENIESTNSNQKLRSTIYLDINTESGDVERSASINTFTPEGIELTEQSLIECTNLYAILHSRIGKDTNGIGATRPKHYNEYSHFSNEELSNVIKHKCSHISYIVEKSLNEIKKARPKLTSTSFTINGIDQPNKEERNSNDVPNMNSNAICKNVTESSVQSVDNESSTREYDENKGLTIINRTVSDENADDDLNTLSSEKISTNAASPSIATVELSSIIYAKKEDTGFTGKTIDEHASTPPVYTDNEYLHHKVTALLGTATTSETSTFSTVTSANTNTGEQEFSGNQYTDEKFKVTKVKDRSTNRQQYDTRELSPTKIVTHEFGNNTVQSFINGTEDVANSDFDIEVKLDKSLANETKVFNQNSTFDSYTGSKSTEIETNASNTEHKVTESEISGNLYFVFDDNQIPAKFVQNLNGSLHLGVDGVTLCDTLNKNDGNHSALLTTLCDCYKSGNCTTKRN